MFLFSQLWETIIDDEQKGLDSLKAALRKRKIKLKDLQRELKSEQDQYKIEYSAYKATEHPNYARKLTLEEFRKQINEKTRKHNEMLGVVRNDEAKLKEKEKIYQEMVKVLHTKEFNSSYREKILERLYSEYKLIKIGHSSRNKDREVDIIMSLIITIITNFFLDSGFGEY